MTDRKARPFLKWAGGKRWLITHAPDVFPKTIKKYFEPFLGSGAIFFFLRHSKAILSDTNKDLVETYLALQADWRAVFAHLEKHQNSHSPNHYYSVRNKIPNGRYARAARFIYLNRTCWNGLYRVNLRGHFNVPIGTKTTVLFPDDDFGAISGLLQGVKLFCSDFEKMIDQAGEGDFVYIDPPYTISHTNNGFIKYNDVLFSWRDQERLRDTAARAVSRGAKVLISNAHHRTIEELYADSFEIRTLPRSSRISGKPSGRQKGTEILILGGYK